MAIIRQFEYFELEPNKFAETRILVSPVPFAIAEVTFARAFRGDVIWLNAVIGGVDNENEANVASVNFKLYQGNIFIPGKEIYSAIQEIDADGSGDITNVPLSFVDAIKKRRTNIRYVLTVELISGVQDVFIRGPITFTASRICP